MKTPTQESPITAHYYQLLATGGQEHATAILQEFTLLFEGAAARLQLDMLLMALKNDTEPMPPRERSDFVFFYQQSVLLYKALQVLYGKRVE